VSELICPYNGNACPGVERCAPAVMKAQMLNLHRDKSIELEEEPKCPIVELIDASIRVSLSAQPFINLLFGTQGSEETPDAATKRVLECLKPDQD